MLPLLGYEKSGQFVPSFLLTHGSRSMVINLAFGFPWLVLLLVRGALAISIGPTCCQAKDPGTPFNVKTAKDGIECVYFESSPADGWMDFACLDKTMNRGVVRYNVRTNSFAFTIPNISQRIHSLSIAALCYDPHDAPKGHLAGPLKCDGVLPHTTFTTKKSLPGLTFPCDIFSENADRALSVWSYTMTPGESGECSKHIVG